MSASRLPPTEHGVVYDRHRLHAAERWEVARTHRLAPASMRWQPRAVEGWRRATGKVP